MPAAGAAAAIAHRGRRIVGVAAPRRATTARGARPAPAAAPPAAAAARGTPPAIAAARRAAAAARGRRQAPTAITITAVRTTITAATTAPTTRRLWSIPTAPVATIAAAGTPAARSRPAWRAGT